jgi:glucokinase
VIILIRKGTPLYMKYLNKKEVLRCIREFGPISRAEVSCKLNISKPTVSALVEELLEDKWIIEEGTGHSTSQGGRKPVQLHFNNEVYYVFGIDIGGTKTAIALCDLVGNIKDYQIFFTSEYLKQGLLHKINEIITEMLNKLNITKKKILGAGIGVPGITNVQEGLVIHAPSLNWKHYKLKEEAEELFGFPVFVDNDVNVCVLAEQWLGAAKNKRNIIFVAIGTGIGSGMILDGKLYRGSQWAAGEIGYMITDKGYAKHYLPVFDGYGFLESVAGGSSIGKRYTDLIAEEPNHPLHHKAKQTGISAEEVFIYAEKGDKWALYVVEEAVENLAFGLINAACLINPEMIILGGGVAKSANYILPRIEKLGNQFLPSKVDFHVSALGEKAGVLGAVTMFLKEHESLVKM